MIRRVVALGLALAITISLSCGFAVKHPAATAGIAAGTTAFVTCELASEDHKNCSIAGGAVGLGLALIAAAALWLGSEDEPEPTTAEPPPKTDWSKIPDTTPKEPTKAPPPPADAGAPVEPSSPPGDAGVSTPDAAPP
jgi:hypothetical protein